MPLAASPDLTITVNNTPSPDPITTINTSPTITVNTDPTITVYTDPTINTSLATSPDPTITINNTSHATFQTLQSPSITPPPYPHHGQKSPLIAVLSVPARFTIIDTVLVNEAEEDLAIVADSEARIMLLYSTRNEASYIMRSAEGLGLTGKNYVWIVTQSVVGSTNFAPNDFPVGMLGEWVGGFCVFC